MSFEQKVALTGAVLTGVEVLTKIAELASKCLPEFFGSGDPKQSTAKAVLHRDFPCRTQELPDSYTPGSRVDWIGLVAIYQHAKHLADAPSDAGLVRLEAEFGGWFEEMNSYHRDCLLKAIEADSEEGRRSD